MIVSTPSSGWFQCAGERGPSIALWLGWRAGQRLAKSDMSWLFVASSARIERRRHTAFHRPHRAAAGEVRGWLHLGAGIATNDYREDRAGLESKLLSKEALRFRGLQGRCSPDAFAGLPDLKPIVADRPGGEMVAMVSNGAIAISASPAAVFTICLVMFQNASRARIT
ncbi:MAG: hypothetical protein IPJ07_17035 [Acidobacteria bacterium]|nr:hypothetical protein [Acidobacteriota bacterium]